MAGSESSNDTFLRAEAKREIESRTRGVYRCMMKSDGMHARGVSICLWTTSRTVSNRKLLEEESGPATVSGSLLGSCLLSIDFLIRIFYSVFLSNQITSSGLCTLACIPLSSRISNFLYFFKHSNLILK